MKHLLVCFAVVSLIGSATVRADLIDNVTGEFVADALNYTRTAYDGSLDKIEIYVADYMTDTASILAMEGTWSGVDGATLYMNPQWEGTFDWKALTTNGYVALTDTCYINFDSVVGDAVWERIGTSPDFSSFTGGWFTSTASKYLNPDSPNLLAVMYVGTGCDVSYTGRLGFNNDTVLAGGFSTAAIPEPSTLALLIGGLFGLAVYAWRKRK